MLYFLAVFKKGKLIIEQYERNAADDMDGIFRFHLILRNVHK